VIERQMGGVLIGLSDAVLGIRAGYVEVAKDDVEVLCGLGDTNQSIKNK